MYTIPKFILNLSWRIRSENSLVHIASTVVSPGSRHVPSRAETTGARPLLRSSHDSTCQVQSGVCLVRFMVYHDLKALIGVLQASASAGPSREDQFRPVNLADDRYVYISMPLCPIFRVFCTNEADTAS